MDRKKYGRGINIFTYVPIQEIWTYFRISLYQNSSLILISISFNMPTHLPTPKFAKISLKSLKPNNAIMQVKTFDSIQG